MSYFTTRIELHAAVKENYDKLHIEMKREGFLRTIKSSAGLIYELPTAEYCKTGSFVLRDVFDSAQRAAKTIGKKYAIVCNEANSVTWDGLAIVSSEY